MNERRSRTAAERAAAAAAPAAAERAAAAALQAVPARVGAALAGTAASAASTVVLMRPGAGGLEVLLTRRPATMAFAPNLHVFPGGRVEPADRMADHPLGRGMSPDQAFRRLAGTLEPSDALAHHIAAVRETLEETGLRILVPDLVPLSRWVTPDALPRRFDVRFFAATVPAGSAISGGSPEVASSRWTTASAALRAAAEGSLEMLLPTLVTLEQLDGLASIDAVAAAFAPGADLDSPVVRPPDDGLAVIEQRWAGGIPGRAAQGWLVGHHDVVLVDPADPTGLTMQAVDVALAERGARLVGIALTGRRPDQRAGVELYATGRGLPVASGIGGGAPYAVEVIEPGERVPFGDVVLVGEAPDEPAPGAIRYRLLDGRVVPPRVDR